MCVCVCVCGCVCDVCCPICLKTDFVYVRFFFPLLPCADCALFRLVIACMYGKIHCFSEAPLLRSHPECELGFSIPFYPGCRKRPSIVTPLSF